MSKKNRYKNKNNSSPQNTNQATGHSQSPARSIPSASSATIMPKTQAAILPSKSLQPEQMSLEAYKHIQECLKDKKVEHLQKEDVTAVVQLAQHLRVFGLLSAVGYIRHAREGKIRERIRPMWTPILWRLVCGTKQRPTDDQKARQELMNETYTLSNQDPKGYMVKWRQSLKLSNHWNFWARAYQEEKVDEQRTEDSNTAR
jgi:hypothetical protein